MGIVPAASARAFDKLYLQRCNIIQDKSKLAIAGNTLPISRYTREGVPQYENARSERC